MKDKSNKLNQNRRRRKRATWSGQQCYTVDRLKKIRTDSSLIPWYLDLVASDLIKSSFNKAKGRSFTVVFGNWKVRA